MGSPAPSHGTGDLGVRQAVDDLLSQPPKTYRSKAPQKAPKPRNPPGLHSEAVAIVKAFLVAQGPSWSRKHDGYLREGQYEIAYIVFRKA